MLVQLHIENYALIDHIVVEFGPGFNVLTGETGTGKSMIIGALALVLGQRAHTDLIRAQDKPTLIEALFDISGRSDLQQELHTLGIELDESHLLLKRVVTKNGSRCYINANLATLAMLQGLGQHLVDILGQHQHHTLLQQEQQRALLDAFGKLSEDVAALRQAYQHYHELQQEYQHLQRTEQERLQRQDLIQFQLQEIDQAQLHADEEARSHQERHLLMNAETLYALSQEVYAALYRNESSASEMLTVALDKLAQLAALDPQQEPLRHDVQESLYVIEEVVHSVRDYGARMDVDPARLQAIEDRLAVVARLKRKYGKTIAEILQHRDTIASEQQSWDQHEERLEALETELGKRRQSLKSLAITLSDKRQQTAKGLTANDEVLIGAVTIVDEWYQLIAKKLEKTVCATDCRPKSSFVSIF
ncbi:MAG: AAA family ATPase [bacterium]|nr:AAA family ATPase [bacterium]